MLHDRVNFLPASARRRFFPTEVALALLLFPFALLTPHATLFAQEPKSPFLQGVDAYRSGDLDLAIACYTDALRTNPGNAGAYNDRGVAYKDKGDLDKALADYNQAIQLKPEYADAYSNRGNVYTAKGDWDKAIADFDLAIQLNPKYAVAYNNRGNAYLLRKDYDKAIADFEACLQLNPEYANAYNNRGKAELAKGDNDKAVSDFSEAIRLSPKTAFLYDNRGNGYHAKGDDEKAMVEYNRAVQLNPKYATAYVDRGTLESAQGDYDKAGADFDQAIRLDPASIPARAGREAALKLSNAKAPLVVAANPTPPATGLPAIAAATPPAPAVSTTYSTVPFKLGDDVPTVQAALKTTLDPIPASSVTPGQQTVIHLANEGIWAFFNPMGKVAIIRVDGPFGGSVAGLRLGDNLEKLTTTLGQPLSVFPFGLQKAYLFSLGEKGRGRFDIGASGKIETIFLLPAPTIVIPQFVKELHLTSIPKEIGSGSFITANGLILTAAHVVAKATRCEVVTTSGRLPATLVKSDPVNDVALLQCQGTDFSPLPILSSAKIRLGQGVFTIGFPNPVLQGITPKFTEGEISSLNGLQDDPRMWQISAPVQPGNSGGPLCDNNGNLVGIVVSTLRGGQNVNYAVKADYILPLLDAGLKLPSIRTADRDRKMEDNVETVRASTVLVLVY